VSFSDLEHKLIDKIVGLEVGSQEVIFYMGNGEVFRMYHQSDCCESVEIADIEGDPNVDWHAAYVGRAEESSNPATPAEVSESGTWTFYRLDTSRGNIVIRWLGQSNGYYSEAVTFEAQA
jgi:hypothetical protein